MAECSGRCPPPPLLKTLQISPTQRVGGPEHSQLSRTTGLGAGHFLWLPSWLGGGGRVMQDGKGFCPSIAECFFLLLASLWPKPSCFPFPEPVKRSPGILAPVSTAFEGPCRERGPNLALAALLEPWSLGWRSVSQSTTMQVKKNQACPVSWFSPCHIRPLSISEKGTS